MLWRPEPGEDNILGPCGACRACRVSLEGQPKAKTTAVALALLHNLMTHLAVCVLMVSSPCHDK